MKRIIMYLLMVAGLSSFYACKEAEASETDIESVEEVKRIIDEKNEQIETLIAEGSIDSVARIFADNVIQMTPHHQPTVGMEEFKANWKESIRHGKWKFDLSAREVKVSEDLAVERGNYTLDFTPNEDSPWPAFNDYGNYLVLWEKEGEEWKIVWDAPVSEKPLPDPSMNGEQEVVITAPGSKK